MQEVSHYLFRGSWGGGGDGGGGGGGGGGERVRKATFTDKLAIDLNGVNVIHHSQLLELSLIYIYASFAQD